MIQGSRLVFVVLVFTNCIFSQRAFSRWPWDDQRQSGMTLGGELKAGVLSDLRRGSKASIKLVDVSYIETAWVALGQLGQCRGTRSVCAYIDATVIGKSRKPGSSEQISKQQLMSSLPEFIKQSRQIEFLGPESITLHYKSQKISDSRLRLALDTSIESVNQRVKNIRLKIRNFRVTRNPLLRSRDLTIRIPSFDDLQDFDSPDLMRRFKGQTTVPFVVLDPSSEAPLGSGDLSFYVNYEMKVLVARDVIETKKRLSSRLFKREWRKVAAGRESYPGLDFAFGDYVARRQINANSILFFRDIKMPNLVHAGDQVVLEIKEGGLMLSALVKARKSGRKGDVIDVVYPSTRKLIKAKIVAKDLLLRVSL